MVLFGSFVRLVKMSKRLSLNQNANENDVEIKVWGFQKNFFSYLVEMESNRIEKTAEFLFRPKCQNVSEPVPRSLTRSRWRPRRTSAAELTTDKTRNKSFRLRSPTRVVYSQAPASLDRFNLCGRRGPRSSKRGSFLRPWNRGCRSRPLWRRALASRQFRCV